jgi:16S rRNA (guanine527-N7)-methyltransferase
MTGTGQEAVTGAPEPPAQAEAVFGETLPLARRYADLLATTGISHGLVGPREAPRLWPRHLINCAVVEALLPVNERVVDIGSGAGLPGIVLAIVRPDLDVHLVEPLLRRTTWLENTVEALGLPNVTVHRGRAQDVELTAPVVTARAVASLDKLVAWAFPLLPAGGRLLALKGEAAAEELGDVSPLLTTLGVTRSEVHVLGQDGPDDAVRVVEIVRPDDLRPGTARRARARAGGPAKSTGAAGRRRGKGH